MAGIVVLQKERKDFKTFALLPAFFSIFYLFYKLFFLIVYFFSSFLKEKLIFYTFFDYTYKSFWPHIFRKKKVYRQKEGIEKICFYKKIFNLFARSFFLKFTCVYI